MEKGRSSRASEPQVDRRRHAVKSKGHIRAYMEGHTFCARTPKYVLHTHYFTSLAENFKQVQIGFLMSLELTTRKTQSFAASLCRTESMDIKCNTRISI